MEEQELKKEFRLWVKDYKKRYPHAFTGGIYREANELYMAFEGGYLIGIFYKEKKRASLLPKLKHRVSEKVS